MKIKKLEKIPYFKKIKKFNRIELFAKQKIKKNLYNSNNVFFDYFFLKKIKDRILAILLAILLVFLIIFVILYYKNKKIKSIISFIKYMNFTDNIDGYYIPKDNLSNPYYKKCSVENCKKCYGHSQKDICISCLKSFIPIMNENHKIILCQYNSTKEENTIPYILKK